MTNSTLTNLSLGVIGMTSKGAAFLAEGLAVNSTLTSLSFFCSDVKDEGVSHIAESNATLTCLQLGRTGVTEKVAALLADVLKTNSTPTTLDLNSGNFEAREDKQTLSVL